MATEAKGRRGRRRGTATKLRRYTQIDNVIIEEPFSFELPQDTPTVIRNEAGTTGDTAGDAYYVSSTVNNRRYYGVLVDQAALKAATLLNFQNEAESLALTRRMKELSKNTASSDKDGSGTAKVPVVLTHGIDSRDCPSSETTSIPGNGKRPALESLDCTTLKKARTEHPKAFAGRTVQKFRYIQTTEAWMLLATFIDVEAAADNDPEKATRIADVCQAGGGFFGEHYYQFETGARTLKSVKVDKSDHKAGIRTSMGFQNFLLDTALPTWYPLSNLQINQHRVFSLLNMKRNKKGGISYDEEAIAASSTAKAMSVLVPMKPRATFRIGVVGGGIAGLCCARELFRLADAIRLNVEVVLLEGRSRLGGRLLTDRKSFRLGNGRDFPCDLGASWIHGIDHNPLAALAKDAGTEFVTASEEVRMLGDNMKALDGETDEKMGKLLDNLLDEAADDAWDYEDIVAEKDRNQKVVRWYGSTLRPGTTAQPPEATDAPPHRHSSDVSIDHAIARAVKKHNHKEFTAFEKTEHSLLLWNIKNIEYALGANINDLSMKFWDSDERHAFEGDHVLLKQGFGAIVDHLERDLRSRGTKFICELDYDVAKIEYARRTSSTTYEDAGLTSRKLVQLSDTCAVTSRNGKEDHVFDFIVSTLPLGVLKAGLEAEESHSSKADTGNGEYTGWVNFDPPLPFTKRDAIKNTGFGLLNKVYLYFPTAFWRLKSVLSAGQSLFGNASGFNSHFYMFFDVGLSLGKDGDPPPVLMTLISGKEAVACERLSDAQLVGDVMATLRKLFSVDLVPEPTKYLVTRWGSDKFSRGCYTFLPPGASDQDFNVLQSPINGNGDSLLLEGHETMRLFWAGEHATALHPSMAHGAMLSGMRAAKEVIETIQLSYRQDRGTFDKMIPMAVFRKNNSDTPLQCNLCHKKGTTVREGTLLAFQKGARQALVHNNCGEFSPEVEVKDGHWKDVVKAVNRGRHIKCALCNQIGATIGCMGVDCFRSFHYGCAQEAGWRFERDGKAFFCDLHRTWEKCSYNECDEISVSFWRSKVPIGTPLRCTFCQEIGDSNSMGKILAFQNREDRLLVHEKCARFTNIMETVEDPRMVHDTDFTNLFQVRARSKNCFSCGKKGATVCCVVPSCDNHFHVTCAQGKGWDFNRQGLHFRCHEHKTSSSNLPTTGNGHVKDADSKMMIASNADSGCAVPTEGAMKHADNGLFQHALFNSAPSLTVVHDSAVNAQMGGTKEYEHGSTGREFSYNYDSDDSDLLLPDEEPSAEDDFLAMKLSPPPPGDGLTVVELSRPDLSSPWKIKLSLTTNDDGNTLLCMEGESVVGINPVSTIEGIEIGSTGLATMKAVLVFLRSSTTLKIAIIAQEI